MSPVSTGFLLLLSFLVVANANVNIQIPTLTDQLQRIHNYGFAQISMGGGEPNGATASEQTSTNSLSSRIRPCEWHYWRLNAATAWGNNLDKTDYLHVNITNVAEDEDLPQASADTFILLVKYYEEDVSSISELPTLDNFDWKITVTAARTAALTDNFMELWPCEMYNTGFYWFAVGGMDFPEGVIAEYDFDVSRRRGLGQCFEDTCSSGAPVTVLPLGQANRINVVHETRRPSDLNPYADQVNQFDQDRLRDWRFFSIDLSGTAYVPGSYLVVNISHVDSDAPTGLTEFLFYSNFGKVPYLVDGHLDQMTDMNGDSPDRCQSSACYAGGNSASACECTVEDYPCKAEREREQSCDLVVGPCTFSYDFDPDSETSNNLWFLGVRIPLSVYDQGTDTLELSFLNFSLWAEVVQPTVTDLVLGIPERGQVAFPNQGLLLYDDAVHYRFELTSVGPNTNLQVHLRNIWTPGSQSQLFAALRAFEKTPGKTTWPDYTLASNQDTYTGCPCYPENDWMCTGCDQCQILVPKCTLIAPASYFLAVGFQSGVATGPIPFEVEVELYDDAAPAILYAGVPVHGQVPWRGYDFYLMNVPNTVRTWLYAELFTNGRAGDVTLRALFGELPGGFCYQDPDFSCSTGDQSSCYFMVDSCHLQEGPLYFSVTGVTSLAERNRNSRPTPTPYTLWAEFETPWELENNVTYTEHLRDAQYNHYYIRAQNVVQGSWWTIEIDNFQGEDFNAYVNYQELAGECPCYSSLFNCTGNLPAPDCSDADPECVPNWDSNYALDRQTYTPGFPAFKQACKIEVDACSFREGIWYISVGIVGESTIQGSPISGYTITSIIHPPPEVRNFPLNFQYVDWVAPHQINHYRLGAVVTDSQTNLVVRLTWMQDEVGRYNGVFSNVALPIHQLLDNGNLNLRLEQGSLALPECYDHPWSCSANTNSYSSCTLVVPYCTWSTWTEDVFVSVQYVPNSDSFDAQFTLEAHLEQESVIPLLPSVEYYGSVNQGRYVHYALDVVPVIQTNTRLTITVYFNSDRKSSPVLLQLNDRAGGERYQSGPCTDCKTHVFKCTDNYECVFDFDPCDIERIGGNVWFISLWGEYSDFYDLPTEFTIRADWSPAVVDIAADNLITTHWLRSNTDVVSNSDLSAFAQRHYRLSILDQPGPTDYLTVRFQTVDLFAATGTQTLQIYFDRDAQAGRCPCYSNTHFRSVVANDNCGQTSTKFVFPPCDFIPGTYYFNVQQQVGGFIQFQIQAWITTQPIENFGTPNNLVAGGPGVFHLGTDPFLYLSRNIDRWVNWNTNQIKRDIELTQGSNWVHYTFTTTTAYANVWYAVNNVVEYECDTDFLGLDVWFNYGGLYTGFWGDSCDTQCPEVAAQSVSLCTAVNVGDDIPNVPCFGALPRCNLAEAGEYSLSFRGSFTPQTRGDLTYSSGISRITFDLRLFTQTPLPLAENTFINVTNFFGQPQEFVLTIPNAGVAPMAQIVIHEIQTPLRVYLRPAPLAGDMNFCAGEDCYDHSCIEVRSGYPVTNDEVLVDGDPIPDLSAFGTGDNVCGRSGNTDCYVALFPCALKTSTTWYLTIVSEEGENDFQYPDSRHRGGLRARDNSYRLFWDSLGDVADTIDQITQSDIDARARLPGVEDGTEDFYFVEEMDSYYLFQFSVTGLSQSIFNGTLDNSDYTRLEVQINTLGGGIALDGDLVVAVAPGTVPPIVPLQGLQAGGHMLESCDSCVPSIYYCYSSAAAPSQCDEDDRLVVPACCLQNGPWWIVARLLTPGARGFRLRVRLVDEKDGTTLAERVDSSQFLSDVVTPLTYPSIVSGLQNDVTGIEPDNYIHYYTTLSESQFYTETASGIRRNALIFTLSKNLLAGDVARPGNVWLYVRRGAVAGQPGRQGGVIWGEDYCHQATYSCVVANDEDVCVIEIPSCQLAADNWFFSVYNDAWYRDFASGLTSPTDFTAGDTNAFYNYLGFDLNIYLRPEESVISAVTSDSVVCINRTESDDAPSIAGTSAHGTYVHYTFTVDDAALAAGCATGDLNCKYEKFLRFEVHNDEDNDAATISSDIDVFISAPYTMTINENAQQLAGQPGSSQVNRYLIPSDIYYGCADGVTNKQVFNVDVGETAIFEAYTCPSDTQLHLRTGTYYLTVRTFEERSYSVCAYMVHPVFETLPAFAAILPVDINDETASVGTSVSYTNSIPRDSEDPDDFYYRFVITPAQAENQRAYLQINLTDVISCTDNAQTDCEFPTNFDDQFYIRVWRSDCESWSCDECALETYYATDPVSTDESDLVSRYVFDRFGMSLCSLESGTYYVHIHNVFGFYDFTLNVRLRTALLHVASFDVPIVSQIWKYQYHVYQLDVSDTRGKSITASLFGDVSCGTLEMFAKHGTPAGPNAPLVASVSTYSDNGCDKCASAYCQTGPQDADTNAVGCDIFIDTFTLSGGAGEQATWYFTVHALSQLNHLVDYLESPVTYNLLFTSHSFEFVETQNGWGCTNVLTYDNTLPACSGSEPDANIPPQQFVFDLDYVPLFGRFALRVDGATAKVVVARNMTVPFGFSGGVGTNDGTIAFDTINPSLFITSTGSQTHSLVTRSATCTANNYLWGPTELNVWVEAAPNTASLSLIRVAAYVANIYPGITYAATVNEPQSYFASFANWYRLADYNRDNFQFRFSWEIEYVVNGDVTFDLYGVAVSDVTNDCDPLTSILSLNAAEGTSTNIHTPQYFLYGVEPRFIRVSGVSQSCANCNPIGYAFHYNLVRVIDHEQLSCGTSFCDVIDDGLEAVYEFLDPIYPIESSRDTTYTVDVPTFTLTDTGSDAPTNAWRTYGLGLATEAQLIAHSYSTVSTSTCAAVGSSQPGKVSLVGLCPFDYLVVQSPSGVPVYPAYFPFRLETVCTPLEITDVTSQVIGTGFVSEVGTAEMAVFSFDLAAASSLEFHNLDISISASCPGVSYTVSATGPSTTACALSSCALTPLQAAVHYVTVHCTADVCDWVLSIHLEEITNTQLTLGAQSTLFQNTGEWDVYYFDVDSLNIDDYLQVEVLSLSANADQEDTSLSVIITQDGSLFDSSVACHCIDSENFQFDFMGTTLGSTVDTAQTVIVDHCYAQATRYYVYIRSPVGCDAHPTQFSLRPLRVSYEISPAALTNGVGLSGSLRFDPTNSNFNFYSFERSGRLGQIRLSDVSGGVLELLIQAGELPRLDSTSYLTSDIYSDLFGRSPFSPNNRVDRTCADCPDPWTCTTDNQLFHTRPADPLNNDCGSCSLAVEDCAWSSASTWYALVSIVSQENVDVPITYTITADDFEDWTSIAQGETSTAVSLSANTATPRQSFGQGNWEHFFYSISTGGNLGAISLRVTVTGDNAEDGVFVTVKDSSCTPEAFFKNIWCSAEYPNWVCEVEIPTRAEYLTSSDTFYIDVYGRQGTFSLTYTYGTDNCQDPTYALSFCSGYVAYPVWNYLDTERYDSEAECLYNELKWRFERERYQSTDCPNQPCWTGISSPCDDNLRRFACYETFPACDGSGFVTGTCRQACQNVEEVCDISFASVDLEQYDCQSSRYLNGNRETCSGAEQLPAPSFDF